MFAHVCRGYDESRPNVSNKKRSDDAGANIGSVVKSVRSQLSTAALSGRFATLWAARMSRHKVWAEQHRQLCSSSQKQWQSTIKPTTNPFNATNLLPLSDHC
jgi:hypothetical protein